jgi:hypothetical protein
VSSLPRVLNRWAPALVLALVAFAVSSPQAVAGCSGHVDILSSDTPAINPFDQPPENLPLKPLFPVPCHGPNCSANPAPIQAIPASVPTMEPTGKSIGLQLIGFQPVPADAILKLYSSASETPFEVTLAVPFHPPRSV